MQTHSDHKHRSASIFILIPALVCFLITHYNTEKIISILSSLSFSDSVTQKLLAYIIPFKISIYFICISIILIPVISELKKYIRFKAKDLVICTLTFILLFFAFYNFRPLSMGYGYAEMSVHPFDMQTGWYYKRLLMPALAYITGFRNITPYFIFSQVISLILILFTYNYLKHVLQNHPLPVKILVLISVCTLEFISFLFFYPGYADHLLSIFILLAFCFQFSERAILCLSLLALCTHELSLFIFLPVLLLKLNGKPRMIGLCAFILYSLVYVWSFNFNFGKLFAVHAVDGKSTLEWILSDPLLFLTGIVISFKLLWILIVKGIMDAPKQQGVFMLSVLACSFLLCLMGVDTSRLMAFAFPALLLAIPVFYQKVKPAYANTLMTVNLLIPFLTVSIPGGFVMVIYFKDFFQKFF